MRNSLKRNMLASLLCGASVSTFTMPALYAAEVVQQSAVLFEIKNKKVSQALKEFADQAKLQIMFAEDEITSSRSVSLQGRYSPLDGLALILESTGLDFVYDGKKNIAIRPGKTATKAGYQRISYNTMSDYEASMEVYDEDERSDEVDGFLFEEILVTATKRATSLQDTPMSISAIGEGEIARRNLVGMSDYLRTIPGVSFIDQGPGFSSIVMRGIAINPEDDGHRSGPVTGVYFGETPISGLGIWGSSADLKLIDMERVEVLKGPQGTLYGAGAMGGVVRNIPKTPDLAEFSGSVKVGYSNTARFGGSNSDVQAVINIPVVEDVLAVRAVAYHFDNDGYYRSVGATDPEISDAATAYGGVPGFGEIGATTYTGGRISALWRPTERFSASVGFVRQVLDQDGWGLSDLAQDNNYDQAHFLVRSGTTLANAGDDYGNEGLKDEVTLAQATLEYEFDWATLSSSTSWVKEDTTWLRDGFDFLAFPWSQYIPFAGKGVVEELRLTSTLEGPLQFIFGYYFEDRDTEVQFLSFFGGEDDLIPSTAPLTEAHFREARSLKHHALFGEVSYDIQEQLTVKVGARGFDQSRSVDTFFSLDTVTLTEEHIDVDSSDVLFKAGIDYKPNEDALIYALWSQGFRLGDVRPPQHAAYCDTDNDGFYDNLPTLSTGVGVIESDTVDNYELGGKFGLMEGRVQVDASIYQIDWKGIPVALDLCEATVLNAGNARSRGAEFSAVYHLESGLSVTLAASYVDAELTETSGELGDFGSPGDRLPGSPKYTASLGTEYNFEFKGNDAYVRGDISYVGGAFIDLQRTSYELNDFVKLDVSAGIQIDQFELSIFGKNLTNDDSLTSLTGFFSPRGTRLQPRTVGIRLGYSF